MSVQCPYRHVSYATWRLHFLRRLCQPLPEQSSKSLPSARDRATSQTRRYSEFRPSVKPGSTETTITPDVSSSSSSAVDPPKSESQRKEPFSPYNKEGRRALKTLLSDLETAGKKFRQGTEPEGVVRTNDEISVPRSPVTARVEDARKRLTTTKRKPTHRELDALRNNPWAEILASPIRACQGSSAKLPAEMLLDFGYVSNPADGKIFLLPAQLADLDALEGKMAKQFSKEERARIYRDTQARSRETGVSEADPARPTGSTNGSSERAQPQPTPPQPRVPTKSRLLSNINFMRLLTREMTQAKGGNVKTKLGQVSKLIHFDSKEAILLAQHYWRHQRDVEVATGSKEGRPAKDSSNSPPFQLRELQWQTDVHARLVSIMQKRVWAAFKALAETETERHNNGAGGTRARVVALPIPENGEFEGDALMQRVSGSSERGDSTSSSSGEVSPSSAQRPEYHLLGHPEMQPGSVFLHIGRSDITSLFPPSSSSSSSSSIAHTEDPVLETQSSSLPPLPPNPLVPPMIRVDGTYRFPVLPLSSLLSLPARSTSDNNGLDEQLNALIAQHPILRNENPNPGTDDDYLLLIQPSAGPTKTLIKEIWALWRYIGGGNMDPSLLESAWAFEGEGEGYGPSEEDDGDDEGEGEGDRDRWKQGRFK